MRRIGWIIGLSLIMACNMQAARSMSRREDAESITDASFLPQVLVGFKHYAHQLGM